MVRCLFVGDLTSFAIRHKNVTIYPSDIVCHSSFVHLTVNTCSYHVPVVLHRQVCLVIECVNGSILFHVCLPRVVFYSLCVCVGVCQR